MSDPSEPTARGSVLHLDTYLDGSLPAHVRADTSHMTTPAFQAALPGHNASFDTHHTYEEALAELARYAVNCNDTPDTVYQSPWGCSEFYDTVTMPGWPSRERTAQDNARNYWVAEHTDRQIVETLLGAEHTTWTVLAIH